MTTRTEIHTYTIEVCDLCGRDTNKPEPCSICSTLLYQCHNFRFQVNLSTIEWPSGRIIDRREILCSNCWDIFKSGLERHKK